MFSLIRAARADDRGAAAVEFALVSFALVLLLVGTIQFGFLFFEWLELTHAAREGARWSSLRHPAGTVATPDTTRYKVAEAAPGLNPRLTDAQIVVTPANPTNDDVGSPVTVTVTHDVPLFAPLMQDIFGATGMSFTLSSSATLRIE
jgi:Flp pilus assembly protein TadG